MTPKKSLENRIRGWFPKEPYLVSNRLNLDYETKKPSKVIPSEYKVSTTKVAGAGAIFWIILYGFLVLYSVNSINRDYPISSFQLIAWTIAGLALGAISCIIFTKNQLGRLIKDYQFSTTGKDVIFLIVSFVMFSIFGFFVSQSPAIQGSMISLYAWGVSFLTTRVTLFAAFEKKENMRIVQRWFGAGGVGAFLVPKPPNGNTNCSESTANKELPSLTGRN
jgi:hypothetical protein